MNLILSDFIQNLKHYRTKKELTQKQLANHLRIGHGNIARYERGEVVPKLDVVLAIAKKLEVSLDALCGLDKEKDTELTLLIQKSQKLALKDKELLKQLIVKFVNFN
ncbi:MAG: helix-turn-helix domain-containing protein [Flavobacteriaceae bacterium]|nr:MAG: helix-turn-helix domain-containing protein [Flavobacteriaceae bacterium]QMU65809.1 MAG: helix-turn-helix domain-containing protein [Flavobacteriaceae bacterium]QMU66210.1 MAG: helix-turn-helix domain-containing protein [Flavobacteriaceae bacterium]QMU66535.1 MAG: helix-turn-helix domain-containing protein [Flavobacteriaceae bacterium]